MSPNSLLPVFAGAIKHNFYYKDAPSKFNVTVIYDRILTGFRNTVVKLNPNRNN